MAKTAVTLKEIDRPLVKAITNNPAALVRSLSPSEFEVLSVLRDSPHALSKKGIQRSLAIKKLKTVEYKWNSNGAMEALGVDARVDDMLSLDYWPHNVAIAELERLPVQQLVKLSQKLKLELQSDITVNRAVSNLLELGLIGKREATDNRTKGGLFFINPEVIALVGNFEHDNK